MDIETMPHAMYFSGNKETITKINQVPYQVTDYDNKGMFQAKLMDDTQVEIFIDNGATPSILPLNVYNKHPILHKYPKTESHTPIHTGGGMIESHFWIEIPLRLENQIIQIKTLVCDSECPYDIVLGHTSSRVHRNYINGAKTEKNIIYPMPYDHWQRYCICQTI